MKACLHNKLNFSDKTVYDGRGATMYGKDQDGEEVRSTFYDDYYRSSYSGTYISDYNSILEERWNYIKSVIEQNDFIPIPPEEPVTQNQFEHNSDYSYTHRTFYW